MQIINNIPGLGLSLMSLKANGKTPGDLRSSSIWFFIRQWRGIYQKKVNTYRRLAVHDFSHSQLESGEHGVEEQLWLWVNFSWRIFCISSIPC